MAPTPRRTDRRGLRQRADAGEDLVAHAVERFGQGLGPGVDAAAGAVGGGLELLPEALAGDGGAVGLLARGARAAGGRRRDLVLGPRGRGLRLAADLAGGAVGLGGDLIAGGPGDGGGVAGGGTHGLVAVDGGLGLLGDAGGGGLRGRGGVLRPRPRVLGGLRGRGACLVDDRLPGGADLVGGRTTGDLRTRREGLAGRGDGRAGGVRLAGRDCAVLAHLAVVAVHDHLPTAVVGDDLDGSRDRLRLGRGRGARALGVVLLDVPAVLGGHDVTVGHEQITCSREGDARLRIGHGIPVHGACGS